MLKLCSFCITRYISLLLYTCKFVKKYDLASQKILESGQFIAAIWHGRILVFPALDMPKVSAVVSAHGDGEFITMVLRAYGHDVIRGSSRKSSFRAARGVLDSVSNDKKNICITPDGPLGPRYKLRGNIVNIASKQDLPILPMCFSATKAIVLKTWDRFVIPLPFSKIYINVAPPVYVREDIEGANVVLENIMFQQMVELDKSAMLDVDY